MTTTETPTRTLCLHCGLTIIGRRDGIWFSQGSSGPTSGCETAPRGVHSPATSEEEGLKATLNMTQGMLNASRRHVEELKAERDKLERGIRDLVYERAELLRNRDAGESLVNRFDPSCGRGRTQTFIADLRNALRGKS